MICEQCGTAIRRLIEGEPICIPCWWANEEDEEEYRLQEVIQHFRTHCAECDAPGVFESGYCPNCEEGHNEE